MPAKAGIERVERPFWIPPCAGEVSGASGGENCRWDRRPLYLLLFFAKVSQRLSGTLCGLQVVMFCFNQGNYVFNSKLRVDK